MWTLHCLSLYHQNDKVDTITLMLNTLYTKMKLPADAFLQFSRVALDLSEFLSVASNIKREQFFHIVPGVLEKYSNKDKKTVELRISSSSGSR